VKLRSAENSLENQILQRLAELTQRTQTNHQLHNTHNINRINWSIDPAAEQQNNRATPPDYKTEPVYSIRFPMVESRGAFV
jgi:hypothetical protein